MWYVHRCRAPPSSSLLTRTSSRTGASSPKGHPLDLSLAILGLTLYGAYFVAGCLWSALPAGFRSRLFLAVAAGGGCFSCYLLYVLKFILKDFCIVCTGFHCVNFSMLTLAILEYWSPDPAASGTCPPAVKGKKA